MSDERDTILNIIGIGESAEPTDIARFEQEYLADMTSRREIAEREATVAPTSTKSVPPKPTSAPGAAAPLPPSPQEFYAKVTQRPDIREILKRLASS